MKRILNILRGNSKSKVQRPYIFPQTSKDYWNVTKIPLKKILPVGNFVPLYVLILFSLYLSAVKVYYNKIQS